MTDKPTLPDKLRRQAEAAQKRLQRLPVVGSVVGEPDPTDGYLVSPWAPEDWELWVCLLLDAFGTRSHNVANAFMRNLADLCPQIWSEETESYRVDPHAFEQAIAIVRGMKVRNEAEAALAASAVALFFAQMKVAGAVASSSTLAPQTASAMAQLAKAYASQLGTLSAMKGGRAKRQVIKVQKNVAIQYNDNRSVSLPTGGGSIHEGQAHGTGGLRARARAAGEPIECAPVPCSDAGRGSVPLAIGEGPEAVPLPRGSEGIGSAKRAA